MSDDRRDIHRAEKALRIAIWAYQIGQNRRAHMLAMTALVALERAGYAGHRAPSGVREAALGIIERIDGNR